MLLELDYPRRGYQAHANPTANIRLQNQEKVLRQPPAQMCLLRSRVVGRVCGPKTVPIATCSPSTRGGGSACSAVATMYR